MVITIITVLAGIAFFLLRPSKDKAIETQIRSDLRQIASAIHLYRLDHDDEFPLRKEALSVPTRYENWPDSTRNDPHNRGTGEYMYLWNSEMRKLYYANLPRMRLRFDPERDILVTAPFWQYDTTNSGPPAFRSRILGARLDGSVSWTTYYEPWENEMIGGPGTLSSSATQSQH